MDRLCRSDQKERCISRYKISDIFVPFNKYEECVIFIEDICKFIDLTNVGKSTLNNK